MFCGVGLWYFRRLRLNSQLFVSLEIKFHNKMYIYLYAHAPPRCAPDFDTFQVCKKYLKIFKSGKCINMIKNLSDSFLLNPYEPQYWSKYKDISPGLYCPNLKSEFENLISRVYNHNNQALMRILQEKFKLSDLFAVHRDIILCQNSIFIRNFISMMR